jgi:hypothetical protein
MVAWIFVVLFMAAAVGLAAAVVASFMWRRAAGWKLVADRLSLDFFPGSLMSSPSMSGRTNGFMVSVDCHNNQSQLTRYSVRYPSIGAPTLGLTKQNSLDFKLINRVLGRTDIEIGDPTFDRRVMIDSADPDAVAQYLSPLRRHAVLALFQDPRFSNQTVTHESITVETPKIESDPAKLDVTIALLLGMAKTMSVPTDVDLELEADHRGPRDRVLETAPPPPPQVVPVDRTPPPPPTPEPAPIQDSTDASPATASLDYESVSNDLFDSDRMGFATDAHFAATYRDRRVHWSGVVDTVRDFRTDSDFEGSGLKVTVTLGYLGGQKLRSRQVSAVLQLDTNTAVERGDEVSFTGTLVRADRFTRNLYVATGVLG